MADHCVFCGHKHLEAKLTRYIYQKEEQLLLVDHVPCLECTFCGEQYFEATVLKQIESDYFAIHQQQKKPKKIMQVAVEDFCVAA
ncbi:MAG: YgiT-type zinc finger protein [Gallionella sp.]